MFKFNVIVTNFIFVRVQDLKNFDHYFLNLKQPLLH